jgi:hypothetical protein
MNVMVVAVAGGRSSVKAGGGTSEDKSSIQESKLPITNTLTFIGEHTLIIFAHHKLPNFCMMHIINRAAGENNEWLANTLLIDSRVFPLVLEAIGR